MQSIVGSLLKASEFYQDRFSRDLGADVSSSHSPSLVSNVSSPLTLLASDAFRSKLYRNYALLAKKTMARNVQNANIWDIILLKTSSNLGIRKEKFNQE